MVKYLFAISICVIIYQSDDWEFKLDKQGVQVFTRWEDGTDIKSFKGITQVTASASDVVALIMDYDRYAEWVDAVSSVRVIQKETDSTYYIHVKVKLPFPVSDRDIVQRIEITSRSETAYEIYIITVPNLIPEEEGYVRMPLSDGHWKIKQIGDDLTQIEMVFANDPGGSIPKWFINMMATNSPFKTMKNMRLIFEE